MKITENLELIIVPYEKNEKNEVVNIFENYVDACKNCKEENIEYGYIVLDIHTKEIPEGFELLYFKISDALKYVTINEKKKIGGLNEKN